MSAAALKAKMHHFPAVRRLHRKLCPFDLFRRNDRQNPFAVKRRRDNSDNGIMFSDHITVPGSVYSAERRPMARPFAVPVIIVSYLIFNAISIFAQNHCIFGTPML